MKKTLYMILAVLVAITSCKKEIEMDYREVAPLVMIEGRVTNEGITVLITQTRNMNDSVRGKGLAGADVYIETDGVSEKLLYDPSSGYYLSPSGMKGQTGKTYRMTADFAGNRYEASSTMPPAAVITSTQFKWLDFMNDRMLFFCFQATDPQPDQLNYYWCRMDRKTTNPWLLEHANLSEAYRWTVFDNRGAVPGFILRDIMCMSEKKAEKDEEDDRRQLLYDGDIVTLTLMTIDRSTFEYFKSLQSGQRGGANPKSNIAGGCLGYFTAGNVSRANPVVLNLQAEQ